MTSDRTRGPLVFETPDGRWALRVGPCAVVVGACLVVGGVMSPLAPLGVATFVVGLAAIAVGLRRRRRLFRCYRCGVEYERRFVLYEEMESIQARVDDFTSGELAVTQWVIAGVLGRKRWNPKSVYTDYHLVLEGHAADGHFLIRFDSGDFGRRRAGVEYLIQAAAAAIARRMKARLDRTGEVAWLRDLVLRSDSLLLGETGRRIPYADLEATLHKADQALELRGRDNFGTTIATHERNFYPGYSMLLENLGARP